MGRDRILRLFGEHVRELRGLSGLSQEALAARAGIHRTYVGGVERGERNISLNNIVRLAEALGVSPRDLFPEDLNLNRPRLNRQ